MQPMKRSAALLAFPLCWIASLAFAGDAAVHPVPSHTVIVVLENRSASQVLGNSGMPFFNRMAAEGALMRNATFASTPYARTPAGYEAPLPARPSQPNYLYLFSGSNQGVLPENFESALEAPYRGSATNAGNGDRLARTAHEVATGIGNRLVPLELRPFTTPNLGAAILGAGGSFAQFSETLPHPLFDEESFSAGSGAYRRKHNPAIDWVNLPQRQVPAPLARFVLPVSANLAFAPTQDPSGQRYRGFVADEEGRPLGYEKLPTVSLVVPNQNHDAHDRSLAEADEWLRKNIEPYARWAMRNNGLLILTFDEDGSTDHSHGDGRTTGMDRVATVFYGPMVHAGTYDEPVDHLNVLSTVLWLHADLEAFRRDFAQAHPGDKGVRELGNLRPILDVFGAGPALR